MSILHPDLFTSISYFQQSRAVSEKLDLQLGFEVAKIEGELLFKERVEEGERAGPNSERFSFTLNV